ncbi:MAG TPA: ABC transporter ATP-binding protein [Stellaceae bacterium]|jgi:ABC-2 type transport system ATP-binding protein|nr:ABC transporter ATP-binding protein [Stellaceae bacterium]
MTATPISPVAVERPVGPPALAVEIRNLAKIYGGSGKRPGVTALGGIDLDIPSGSIFGLLGPNGAGKSTLINILAGLVVKTAGSVRIWDIDLDREPRQSRAAIGIVPQEIALDFFFTPRELLDMQAGFYGVPKAERRTDEILAAVALLDKADVAARGLSGGMKRRLMVAKAMVHNPPVLVLDEPTAGVDVELRQHLWAMVRDLQARGTTILLTTHYLEEAEELCDRIAIINHGKLVACDTTGALLGRVDDKSLIITVDQSITAVPEPLAALGFTSLTPGKLTLRYAPSRTHLGDLLAAIVGQGLAITDISSQETDLEDIFLQLTRDTGKTP